MYNPQAGNGSFSLEETCNSLLDIEYQVVAYNTKKSGYKNGMEDECDLMIIAGGDGTVEKILREMKKEGKNFPIAILPYGSANNVAKSLGLQGDISAIVKGWKSSRFKLLSVGEITTGKETRFFLESVGWGVFINLLKAGNSHRENNDKEEKMRKGAVLLQRGIADTHPTYYELFLDGINYSGQYLWIEVMNSPRMGPALTIAPSATTEDSFLDIFLVGVDEREKLQRYFSGTDNPKTPFPWDTVKVKEIWIGCAESFHVDDEIIHHSPNPESTPWSRIVLSKDYIRVIDTEST